MSFKLFMMVLLVSLSVPTWAKSPESAASIMRSVFERSMATKNFQADMVFYRQDPNFMEPIFGKPEVSGVIVSVKGSLNYYTPCDFNLFLKISGNEELHLFSGDGMTLVIRKPLTVTRSSPAQVSPDASLMPPPLPGATPAVEVSPSPSPTPMPTHQETITLRGDVTGYFYPFALIFPYNFRQKYASDTYTLRGTESVYGRNCYVLELSSPERGEYGIWVDQTYYTVNKIMYYDPSDSSEIVAYYRNFQYAGRGYNLHTLLEVQRNRKSIFMVELTNMEANVNVSKLAGYTVSEKPPRTRLKPKLSVFPGVKPIGVGWEPEKVYLLSPRQTMFVIILVGMLGYFGFKLVKFVMGRSAFSREIIVVDSDGVTSRILKRLGYKVVSFSPEVLTRERKLLGRGVRRARPRAVVVGPDASIAIKSHMYLLRAYVEEGGRVLLLPHTIKSIAAMPINPYFVPPQKTATEGTVFSCRSSIWKRLKVQEIENNVEILCSAPFYLSVNERKVDQEMVAAYNKYSGIKGVVVGLLKEGRGEYLFCQLDLIGFLDKETSVYLAQNVLMDLVDFLQGEEKVIQGLERFQWQSQQG